MGAYKDALTKAMNKLAEDSSVCFVGYGVRYGGRAAGTLKDVRDDQLIETPVAENLMVGVAIGLSLKGRIPVVYIERFDFITNALDAIVNHLDKMKTLSKGEFAPAVILRVVVGNREKPLFTGITHTQDFTEAMKKLVSFKVKKVGDYGILYPEHSDRLYQAIDYDYNDAHQRALIGQSTMLVEYKDLI